MKRTTALVAALSLAVACSGGGGPRKVEDNGSTDTTGTAAAQQAELGMEDTQVFRPNTVRARVGTLTLTVKNLGGVPHNLVFDDTSLGRTGTIDGRSSATLTLVLAKAGTFTFVCTFHPRMTGQVIVS